MFFVVVYVRKVPTTLLKEKSGTPYSGSLRCGDVRKNLTSTPMPSFHGIDPLGCGSIIAGIFTLEVPQTLPSSNSKLREES